MKNKMTGNFKTVTNETVTKIKRLYSRVSIIMAIHISKHSVS